MIATKTKLAVTKIKIKQLMMTTQMTKLQQTMIHLIIQVMIIVALQIIVLLQIHLITVHHQIIMVITQIVTITMVTLKLLQTIAVKVTKNNNQSNSSNSGQQTHVVSGNENLYRIAIQYYGEGTVENVNKLKQANGLSSNNISNGQKLIIPQ